MKVGDYCKRGVVTVSTTDDVVDIAKTMRDEHVGFVVVLEEGDPQRIPRGVITDRDIVLKVCAREIDGHSVTAADIMSRDPLIAREADDLSEVLQGMRLAGIRRIPVVTTRGTLTGIIAVDDAIDVIAGLLCDVSGSIRSGQHQERRLMPSVGARA